LTLAELYCLKTIAFPAISTGAYAFPMERASKIAIAEIQTFLAKNTLIDQVILVAFNTSVYELYLNLMSE